MFMILVLIMVDNAIAVDNMLGIHKYLMEKNNIK